MNVGTAKEQANWSATDRSAPCGVVSGAMQHADVTLQDIVDALAARLARSVAIDDPQFRLLAASQHFGDEDQVRIDSLLRRRVSAENIGFLRSRGIASWQGPSWVPPHAEFGAQGRFCVPVRCRDLLLGYLWLIDPTEDGAGHHATEAVRAADAAGVVLYRNLVLHEQQQRRGTEVLLDLLSSDPQVRSRAVVAVRDERLLPAPGDVVVLTAAVHPESSQRQVVLLSAAEHALRPLPAGAALLHAAGGGITVLISHGQLDPGLSAAQVAQRLVARVVDLSDGDSGCWVGVGSTQPDLGRAVTSYRHAASARRVARAVPAEGPVAEWERLGAYALLSDFVLAPVPSGSCPAPVARLLAAVESAYLFHTLEIYLDMAGDAQRTAAALGIHRTTLYYRLNRAEQIAGVDLRDGRDRLTVHLGVKLARFAGWVRDDDEDDAFRHL